MLNFLKSSFKRRRLKLIVDTLPSLLKVKFGSGKFYTSGQVKACASVLKMNRNALPYALATACSWPEFSDALPSYGEDEYQKLRDEMARLFWLDEASLNCERLSSKFKNPSGLSNSLDKYAAFHDGGSGHSD